MVEKLVDAPRVRADHHYDSCRIDFSVAFDRSVEVVFRPNLSVRRVEARDFCVGGPQVTPHVVVQQLVPAGETRTVTPLFEEGRHRLRSGAADDARTLLVTASGSAEPSEAALKGFDNECFELSRVKRTEA